ncbi:hypothetical protein WKV44_08475 [Spirochaetia bacterium 38H-sp]|uniref:Lipoprotein n=1 Tax=Rarispira pelagica TaxID=3141764 RepID=A0ABU9UD32_9SPIR
MKNIGIVFLYIKRFFVLLSFVFLFFSCSGEAFVRLSIERTISLDFGRFEDEIVFFPIDGKVLEKDLNIFLRNGRFFISNASVAKVMEFSSYGELLRLWYNPGVNPLPVSVATEGDTVSTRKAFSHGFVQNESIAVTSSMSLYVEDYVASGYSDFSNSSNNQVVLRFDSSGTFKDYIGREGVAGSPFPYIVSINVTVNDELVVICRQLYSWDVYVFTVDGSLEYFKSFSLSSLPLPDGYSPDSLTPSIDTVVSDFDGNGVYVKYDYFIKDKDTDTGSFSGLSKYISRVYFYDFKDKKYLTYMELPEINLQKEQRAFARSIADFTVPYDFIGAASGNKLFFVRKQSEKDDLELLIYDLKKELQKKFILDMPYSDPLYVSYTVSPEGILGAIIVTNDGADLVWWRTDSILYGKGQ